MFRLIRFRVLWLLAVPALCVSACHAKSKSDLQAANQENFTRGMVIYLAARGELCLGKEFPLDVTEREFAAHARNAVQMPALEHLGLVSSENAMSRITTEDGPVTVPVTRFQLTATGRQYYREHASTGEGTRQHGDLCVAKLSLDKVASWELTTANGNSSAVVSYTYHVEAAPWTRAPEVKAVFPAVERVVTGAEQALLKEGFTLTTNGWIANELAQSEPQPVAKNAAR